MLCFSVFSLARVGLIAWKDSFLIQHVMSQVERWPPLTHSLTRIHRAAHTMCRQSQLLFSIASSNRYNFWHSELRDNCESAFTSPVERPYLIKRFRQVRLHFSDKQNSQTVKPEIQKFTALTWHTEHWQHHKMCSKCPPRALTQAEIRRHHWWSSFPHSTNM